VMASVLVDTDILIDASRKLATAVDFLDALEREGSVMHQQESFTKKATRKGLNADPRRIEGFCYTDPSVFPRGLRRLVRLLAEEIHLARAEGDVAIAATRGFKAEIAVANLVVALLGAPVYYIYEQFQELILRDHLRHRVGL
jgi:hypothetical protein